MGTDRSGAPELEAFTKLSQVMRAAEGSMKRGSSGTREWQRAALAAQAMTPAWTESRSGHLTPPGTGRIPLLVPAQPTSHSQVLPCKLRCSGPLPTTAPHPSPKYPVL